MPPRVIGSFCILGTAPLLRWGKWGICPGQATYRGAKSLIPAPLARMQVSELHRAWAHADPAARCPLLKLFREVTNARACKQQQLCQRSVCHLGYGLGAPAVKLPDQLTKCCSSHRTASLSPLECRERGQRKRTEKQRCQQQREPGGASREPTGVQKGRWAGQLQIHGNRHQLTV